MQRFSLAHASLPPLATGSGKTNPELHCHSPHHACQDQPIPSVEYNKEYKEGPLIMTLQTGPQRRAGVTTRQSAINLMIEWRMSRHDTALTIRDRRHAAWSHWQQPGRGIAFDGQQTQMPACHGSKSAGNSTHGTPATFSATLKFGNRLSALS